MHAPGTIATTSPPAVGVRRIAAAARVSVAALVIVTLVPIAVAAGRAIRGRWLPLGDNAVIALRARDVLSEHLPLLGLWSSASLTAGTHLNHPGPLLFDWLALPAGLFDGGTGIVLGMALLNGLAVIGIAVLAFRRGGPLLATAALAVTAALCWAMGSELLVEPWHAHAVVLPFLCYFMLVWSLACGDLAALPWAAMVGSLVAQTNVTYAPLVAALGAWGLVGLILARRREDDPGTRARRSREGQAARIVAVGGLVLAGCWVQPLVEQFFASDGAGNLTRLARAGSSPSGAIGYGLGTRMFASVVSLPPWGFRPSFRETLVPSHGWRPPSPLLAAMSLGVLALVLGSCARLARRWRDLESSRAIVTAVVGLLAGVVTAGRTPRSTLGIAVGHFRWLWPLAAFVLFAVVATCARRAARATAAPAWLVTAFTGATVVFAALNLPSSDQGTSAPEWPMPTMRALGRQLAVLEGRGTLFVDVSGGLTDYYGTALLAELERRDVPFVVADAGMVRQLGPSRRFSGTNADGVLFVRTGDDALVTPPSTRRVALHEALSPREQLDLADLEDQVREYLRRAHRLPLTRRGREIVRLGYFPDVPRRPSRGFDPDSLVASRSVVELVQSGLLSLDARWAPRFERYADLQDRWDRETAAVFLGPLNGGTAVGYGGAGYG